MIGMHETGADVAPGIVLRTERLSKDFAGFKAVSDVNLTVREGTLHAVIGPNGAGKTTLFNLLTRFLPASSGRIYYRGREISRVGPAAVARLGMVRSFQISAVFPHLTVRDNIGLALQRLTSQSYRFWRHESCLDDLVPRAEEMANTFRLGDVIDTRAIELPYGRRRALEIATTLALDPDLVLLDEPMAGLAHGEIDPVADLIKAVAKTRTVVMIEHNLSVVAKISDRITVLTRGSVLAEGTYAEIAANPLVVQAYMGGAHA